MLLSFLTGCQEETIHTYTAPKATTPSLMPRSQSQGPAEPTRMLAAILRQPDETWFFKLTSEPDETAALREAFGKFVASTNFVENQPSWEIPNDWLELPEKPMRFTTYQVGADGPELSISTLPNNGDEIDAAVANINRWRGQLGLEDLTAPQYLQALGSDNDSEILPEAESEIVSITTPAGKAILVDFVGAMSSGGGPPFANRGMRPPSQPPAERPSSNPKLNPAENWSPGELNAFRLAAYQVGEGDQTAEITLSTAGGDLLSNVNRWRGQVDLPGWSADELAEQKQKLIGQGYTADYVQLMGPANAILGAVINHENRTWFVKLTGPKATAEQERENFEAFVKTIEF